MRLVTRQNQGSALGSQSVTTSRSKDMTLAHGVQASGGLRVSGELHAGPIDIGTGYYLLHHGVVKESSETTKLRVVFNGSTKTSSGKSIL